MRILWGMFAKLNLYSRITKWFRERERKGKGYKVPLDDLVFRVYQRFKEHTGFDSPVCPQCFLQRDVKVKMEFRHSNIVIGVPNRDDQAWKCFYCYHTLHHGLPITKKDALEEVELRGGSTYLMRPTYRVDERDNEAVLKRLSDLGYIE